MTTFSVLIIGASPFGLALAAYLRRCHISYLLIGKPALFWKVCYPGAQLALASDWHLDPLGVDTVDAYRQTQKATSNPAESKACDSFPDYVRWFQKRKQLEILPWAVESIASHNEKFVATMHNGEQISAPNVVLATCHQTCSLAGCKVSAVQTMLPGSHDLFARLDRHNGCPQLDHQFQTSLPGLFIVSMTADQDISRPAALFAQARASATSIGQAIHHRIQPR